jgi:hypothetical protein
MARISKNFLNVVALGSFNPQILNVDFLTHNRIVDPSEPGFEILNQPKKCKDFLSTPPFARLDFGTVEFIIQQERYQIKESPITQWVDNKIVRITKAYFGVLPHTPIRVVGINMNLKIQFDNNDEANSFNQLIIPGDSQLIQIIPMNDPEGSIVLRYPSPFENGRATLSFGLAEKTRLERSINFNHEFDYSGSQDWAKLDDLTRLGQYVDSMADTLSQSI